MPSIMIHEEHAVTFGCEGKSLVGVLTGPSPAATRGVLIIVGGPQYRVGSHRQFALLARYLAERGVPTLRFDYRGMGDSEGEARTFESVGEDIRCAVDRLFSGVPALKDVVLWGLCDAASAALFYAHRDSRISGVVLLNPWVRTPQGLARAQLKLYYIRRLFDAGLWRKVARREFRLRRAAAGLRDAVLSAMGRGTRGDSGAADAPLPDRMQDALRRFRGKVLLILSGNDLTAQEFKDVVAGSSGWRKLLGEGRVTRHDLAEANHTFAQRAWRDRVASWTETWVRSL
jgi:exosortase A-associated hydrolase 1